MKHGSLFSGIGGFDLAAEWMRWENIFHCEWEEFPQKVLQYHWPEAISYGDITATDFRPYRGTIDVLTGGFPCQPYSTAGKRLGKEDDRHLWPEMLRAIREIQPSWVVGENVRGLVNWNGGLVFDEVQTDLEAEGYEVQPFLLPACAVNAPHRRDRIWFVAFNSKFKYDGRHNTRNSEGIGLEMVGDKLDKTRRNQSTNNIKPPSNDAPNPQRNGLCNNATEEGQQLGGRGQARGKSASPSNGGATPNTERIRSPREEHRKEEPRQHTQTDKGFRWKNFPTQPPVLSGNDGISERLDGITFPKWRNESIKSAGNAIVPQVVFEIFKAIEQQTSQTAIAL